MARKPKPPPPPFATTGDWHNHFTPFFDDQLNSLAYVNLTAHAKEAYTIIRQEYKGNYTGDKVICPYSTFASKGMRANTVSRAILQLECYGFISIDRGGLEHRPSVYHLISDWKKIRTEEELSKAKERFEYELEKKRKTKEVSAAIRQTYDTASYGKYTSSNGSVSKDDEKTGGIDIEYDSVLSEILGVTPTKTIAEQVPKPSPENESDQATKAIAGNEPWQVSKPPLEKESEQISQVAETITERKTCQVPKAIFEEKHEDYQPRH